ncbi:MAG: 50S ribosomal protein L3 N(5)-glutamine methyltransferase [Endozoicomonas sp.]
MTTSRESFDGLFSIRDFIRWSTTRFNDADLFFGHGSDNAFSEAKYLVFQLLQLPWDLPENYLDSRLTENERQRVAELIEQRITSRKPLAYLVHQAWFCGMPFYVDERVLVPRSPIAEMIMQAFQPWLGQGVEVNKIMDLCCGSGCIGIAAALAFPNSEVALLDISPDALEVANINIDQHELWGRVQAIQSDLFETVDELPKAPQYQLILSNPPYVDVEDMSDMPEEFSHEPELGLTAGSDGLDFARKILARAADFLDQDGLLVLEVGNSHWALRNEYPDVPFIWPDFKQGGHGILVLSAKDCRLYQPLFKSKFIAR